MLRFFLCRKSSGGEIVELKKLEDVISFRYSEDIDTDLRRSGSVEHLDYYPSGSHLLRCYNDDTMLYTLKICNQDEDLDSTKTHQSTLYDTCYFLEAKKTVYKYSIPEGSNIVTFIKLLCSQVGVWTTIDDGTLITSKALVFDEGTSYLNIINSLLDVAGYGHIYSGPDGHMRIRKEKVAGDKSDHTITSDNVCMLRAQTKKALDDTVPNCVALVYESEKWNAVGLAYNNEPDSEYSLSRRGYEVTSVEKIGDVGTETATQHEIQTELDIRAAAKMRKLVYNERKYEIGLLWYEYIESGDLAYIETMDGNFSLYKIINIQYNSEPGIPMTLEITSIW